MDEIITWVTIQKAAQTLREQKVKEPFYIYVGKEYEWIAYKWRKRNKYVERYKRRGERMKK